MVILNFEKFMESMMDGRQDFGGNLPSFVFKGVNYGDSTKGVDYTFGDKPRVVPKQRDRETEMFVDGDGAMMDEYQVKELLLRYDKWCMVNKVDKIPTTEHPTTEVIDYIVKTMGNFSENLKYHIDNKLTIMESVFRYGSESFFTLINEIRSNDLNDIFLSGDDISLLESTDIGKIGIYNNKKVWLDIPFDDETLNEAEYKGKKVDLGKPKRGGTKKFYVYVKNDKGNVVKVQFGAKDGGGKLSVKLNDPKARSAFDKRHGCSAGKHEDKSKPGYWSCRLPRYAKMLGLSGGGQWW